MSAAADRPSASQPQHVPPSAVSADVADERRQLAGRILIDALLLGVVGDALLRVPSWGVNLTAWSIGIVAALLTLAKRRNETLGTETRWLAGAAIVLSLLFAWHDSAPLATYNALALVATVLLLAMTLTGHYGSLLTTRVRDVAAGAFRTGIGTAFGMFALLLSDVSLRQVKNARGASVVISVVRASLIAIPLLLLFGALFAGADPVFARLAGDVLRVDPEQIATHLLLTGVIAFVVGGFLRTTVLATSPPMPVPSVPDGALGLTEVSVTLGSLVLLFASFVAVQLRYFFGGDALVQVTAGLSYADYARRGFFELVTVSALVLPVLLSANALLRRDRPVADRVYRILASALLVLLAVIMYSAFARMQLYQSVYGMSTDRLYATVFMGWLVIVFALFSATVLRGNGKRFVAGAFVSAWGTLIALNIANPAALVARSNVARAATGTELDVAYLESLGADAAPALVTYLAGQPLTPPSDWVVRTAPDEVTRPSTTPPARDSFTSRCHAARRLLEKWGPTAPRDWRSWTAGRGSARRVVATHAPALRTLASVDPRVAGDVPCPQPPAAPNATATPAAR